MKATAELPKPFFISILPNFAGQEEYQAMLDLEAELAQVAQAVAQGFAEVLDEIMAVSAFRGDFVVTADDGVVGQCGQVWHGVMAFLRKSGIQVVNRRLGVQSEKRES